MNILHVALGLPPLRTGGLTRYCSELMEAQISAGNRVSLVYPGRFLPGPVRFRKGEWHGIETHELINPLPVALTFGVAEPDAFIVPCRDIEIFENLIRAVDPDIVHVHSFMGIYREFFQVIKRLNVPLLFTTHDYYPMCPRCTFVDADGESCIKGPSAELCASCCRGGMTRGKSQIMQSSLYAKLKSTRFVKKVRAIVKSEMGSETTFEVDVSAKDSAPAYDRLLDYNSSIFRLFDIVLANSLMTEKIFRSKFPDSTFRIVRISHAGLVPSAENEEVHRRRHKTLVLGYFGGKKKYKGYGTLMAAARILHDDGVAFELRLFGDEYGELDIPEAHSIGYVSPDEVHGILKELDAVVVPSIYHETFGFVVLEALSEGLPVICSDAVGASELVTPATVFPSGNARALADVSVRLKKGEVEHYSLPADYPISMADQVNQLSEIYASSQRIGVVS